MQTFVQSTISVFLLIRERYDILPLTYTANAFNKILNYGEGFGGVLFEIFMICLLTVIYFAAGLVLYQKRKLSKA